MKLREIERIAAILGEDKVGSVPAREKIFGYWTENYWNFQDNQKFETLLNFFDYLMKVESNLNTLNHILGADDEN